MDGRDTLVRDLDLPPGYYAERSEAETYLMDPDGRRVMRLPASAPSRDRVDEPTQEEWRDLCRSLLIHLSEQTAECERLRVRVARLEERVEAAEDERDQSNAIAEDLYDFFSRRVREVVDSKKPERRTHVERTERRPPEASWMLNDSRDGADRGGM